MKTAYLWIVDWEDCASAFREKDYSRINCITGDLFFSSIGKFKELYGASDVEEHQLVPVQVPDDFQDWDYIPDNY